MATQEMIDDLVTKMTEERNALISAARSLSAEDALRVPVDAQGEEQWTAREQLSHLWEMERAYVSWVNAALRSDNPDLRGIVGAPVEIPIEEANGHATGELIEALGIERADTLRLIESLPLPSFERTATSPNFGTLTVLQYPRSFYRHDRMHGAQIQGRKSDYQPRYQEGINRNNQRQQRIQSVAARQQEKR